MGQSTNAILFYGYCWTDEARNPWLLDITYENQDDYTEEEMDKSWEERYVRLKHGLTEPNESFPERTWKWDVPHKDRVYPPDEQVIVDKYSAFWKRRDELAKESGVECDDHCSSECPMPFVCIADTKIVTYRGDKTDITPEALAVNPFWGQMLREFCELMKIPVPDEGPKWWLVSYWG